MSEIEIGAEVAGIDGARRNGAGQACQKGHLEALLIDPALVEVVVFTEKHALVRGVDHEGVLTEA